MLFDLQPVVGNGFDFVIEHVAGRSKGSPLAVAVSPVVDRHVKLGKQQVAGFVGIKQFIEPIEQQQVWGLACHGEFRHAGSSNGSQFGNDQRKQPRRRVGE